MGLLLFLISLAGAATPPAKLFSTSYLELMLPGDWNCELKQSQYVCIDSKYANRNYAVLVISAKRAAPDETLQTFMAYLQKPIRKVTPKYQELVSKVEYVKQANINGLPWIDALHFESEVPSYFTRYLATRKEDVSALVSFSYHKNYRPVFEKLFADLAASIKMNATMKITEEQNDVPLLVGQNVQNIDEAATIGGNGLPEMVRRKSTVIFFVAFAIVCFFFIFITMRNRKK